MNIMISEDDFIDDETDRPAEHPPDPVHVQFFINYVKLSEIMGLVLSQLHLVASRYRRANAIDLTHGDMALADWLQNCPPEVRWDRTQHHFWAALLHANYYTTLCLLHRAHMPPIESPMSNDLDGFSEEHAYPSRNIAYRAADMITSIIQTLQAHDEIRYAPAFIVYSLFSALTMHVYQMKFSNESVVLATEQRLQICLDALKEVSKVWLIAKMVHILFESILDNKNSKKCLQEAGDRDYKSNELSSLPPLLPKLAQEAPKRKFEETDFGGLPMISGSPAAQLSYEEPRPQTPIVMTPQELPPQSQRMPQTWAGSPQMNRYDHVTFMGPSRLGTRPTTPFKPSYSYLEAAPDPFLITRDTPNIGLKVWHDFQPDHLFPADSQINFPRPAQSLVDPALSQSVGSPQSHSQQPHQQTQNSMNGQSDQNNAQAWAQQMEMMQQNQEQYGTQGDIWSNSSGERHNPVVSMSLGVDEWFSFFGINGEADMLHLF
ncbi:Transcriptional activator of fatty acid utilization [Didymella glomerata]|uniref:Transcriptional activator of fatty acid utilization n=1 Tax=Didymella glomerata TaxID=749621 RepID=A0A9W9BWW4_9PLEO|nr:Transcriptional activator of fatty acid utilization [Didymella glomerata]